LRNETTIPVVGNRQKAHVHVQARLATSCRQTFPTTGIAVSLLQSTVIIFKLSRYGNSEYSYTVAMLLKNFNAEILDA
jgi:hypothetical protein